MTEQEQLKYKLMEEMDQRRFDAENACYKAMKVTVAKSSKSQKDLKNENNEKLRPMSSFLWFCQEERPKMKAQHPELGSNDIVITLGRKWHQLMAEENIWKTIPFNATYI